jgi:hypothetical protein
MKKEYKILELYEGMPEGSQVGDDIEIEDYALACGLVERGLVMALNTHG